LQAAEALADHGVKCLVIACNTASAAGLSAICQRIESVPVIGVIEPGAEAACAASRSGHVAVIATEGTVRGGAYQEAIIRKRPDARVSAVPAPLFVALAEEGLTEGPIADGIARHYLDPLFHPPNGSVPDTLVLGCTHFPMLLHAIRRAVGPHVRVVDSAATTAASVRSRLERAGLVKAPRAESGMTPIAVAAPACSTLATQTAPAGASASGTGTVRFLATDGAERFARIGGLFLARRMDPHEVELVDL
jgi:glutamate racemase